MENKNEQLQQLQAAEIYIQHSSKVKPSQRPKINSSKDAFTILKHSWDVNRIELIEQFKVLLTNRANKAIGLVEISTGGIAGTVLDPKLVFVAPLKAGACGMILSHYAK